MQNQKRNVHIKRVGRLHAHISICILLKSSVTTTTQNRHVFKSVVFIAKTHFSTPWHTIATQKSTEELLKKKLNKIHQEKVTKYSGLFYTHGDTTHLYNTYDIILCY